MQSNDEIRKTAEEAWRLTGGERPGISITAMLLGGTGLSSFIAVQILMLAVSRGLQSGRFAGGARILKFVYIGLALYLIVSAFVGSFVELGLDRIMLMRLRGDKAGRGTLFYYRSLMFEALFLRLFMSIRVTLWSFLLLVPGIAAVLNYALAPFLFARDPALSVPEAIRISKYLMKGYKRKLLKLILGYAGEIAVSILLLGIPFIYVMPKVKCAVAAFYRDRVREHDEELARIQESQGREQ